MSTCRSCGKAVVFVVTARGRTAPFELDAAGEYVIERGIAKHAGPPAAQTELGSPPPPPARYTSHFATCPNAAAWRSKC